ncbi:MAG: glutamate 5-kinase [Elusimicrobia bacterium]|jgi:glutamate 5-kinase|nr:glutamate 5-kinase [Elusimicrobiota bacterium]
MRIVVKLGTKLLTGKSGLLDFISIERITDDLGALIDEGHEIIVVSSGAVGAGCGVLEISPARLDIRRKQAVASIGQTELMNVFKRYFKKQKRLVGQILITSADLSSRKSYLNIRNTIFTLLDMGAVPVINENDTVAVEELKLGDNDKIAGIVTAKVDADKLVILTDVEGLYDDKGKLIKEVRKVNRKIYDYASGKGTELSVGGMRTKLNTANKLIKLCGANMYIADGTKSGVLKNIAAGGNPGTVFIADDKVISQKKRWIAYGSEPRGKVFLDEGAVSALIEKNRSLLPVGVRKAEGCFSRGDLISCVDQAGAEIARGLTNYSSREVTEIAGVRSSEIKEKLGYMDYQEIIHRDNLVVI